MSDTPLDDTEDVPCRYGTKLYQIDERDLAELERILPAIFDRAFFGPSAADLPGGSDNRMAVQMRRVQRIITDVRWNYFPPRHITRISADDPPTQEASQ